MLSGFLILIIYSTGVVINRLDAEEEFYEKSYSILEFGR